MKDKKRNKKKGFTLIELLIVVLIIGVLAGIALPAYMKAIEKSRVSEPLQTLGTIAKAQQRHKLQDASYANQMDSLDIELRDYTSGTNATGSTFDSEYFNFTLLAPEEAKAQAERKNNDYTLYVNYETGKITCSVADENNKICESLGLESVEPVSNDDGDWVDCASNVSALASMLGLEGMEAELEAQLSYIPYCKMKSNQYKMCMENYCEGLKTDNNGCRLQMACSANSSNECQGEVQYDSGCNLDLGDNFYLEKECVAFDAENFECNEWQNKTLSWNLQDGVNYWSCDGDHIAADGKSCTVYDSYRVPTTINGQSYDLINCDHVNHNGVDIASCDIREYDDDGNQLLGAECHEPKYSEVYDGAISGTLNANHTGCETYAHYWDYVNQLYCDNGTCSGYDKETGNSYTCTANAKGNGCASSTK